MHYISRIRISRLWGYRTFTLKMFPDVNILIGPNASGKTTIINMLFYLFSGQLQSLTTIVFESLEVSLVPFAPEDENTAKTVLVTRSENGITVGIDDRRAIFNSQTLERIQDKLYRQHFPDVELKIALLDELVTLVPAVWLPTSRRLPVRKAVEYGYAWTRHVGDLRVWMVLVQ